MGICLALLAVANLLLVSAELGTGTTIVVSVVLHGLVFAGLILVFRSAVRNATQSVLKLRSYAARLSRGKLDQKLPELPDQDTQKLGLAYRNLAESLRDLKQDLETRMKQQNDVLTQKSRVLQAAHDDAIEAIIQMEMEIKQREAMEEQLKDNELHYRNLVSNLPGIVMRCEPKPPFRLMFVSDDLQKFGISKASDYFEASNDGIRAMVVEEDQAQVLSAMEKSIDKRESFYLDFRIETSGEREGWINLRGTPIERNGEVTSLDCFAFDITEQREADRKLRDVLEQQALQRGKLEMSSNVLHDIGNAVTNVGTTVSRLVSDKDWSEVDELKRLVKFIGKQKESLATAMGEDKSEALLEFLEQLQNSFRARSGSQHETFVKLSAIVQHVTEILHLQRRYSNSTGSSSREAINIRDVLHDTLSIVSGSIDKRGILLDTQLGGEIPTIQGDRTRLLQVFINVIKNSCEAIDTRLEKEPEAARKILITINLDDPTNLGVIIKDSGIGFDEETSKKFFQRGFTTKTSGSGIGLDQCNQILKAHGGHFSISSDGLRKGATTVARFPIQT